MLAPAYQAVDSSSSRSVLIVVLPALDTVTEPIFDAGAAQLIRLRHPGITRILTYGVEDGIPYLVLEEPYGRPLGTMIGAGALLPIAPIDLLRQVAGALDFAHAAGVVHGDLQPDMILIDEVGHVSIIGFGIAPLLLASGRSLPPTPYRAPEQTRSGEATPAADRYSFASLASAVLQESIAAGANGDRVDRVLLRGLDQTPSDRWPSCMALVDALSAALQPAAKTAPSSKTPRGLWIAAGGVGAIAVLALLLAVNHPASEPAPAAAPPAMNLSRTTTVAGATLVVSAQNLPPNQAGTVELESHRQQLSMFTADAVGAVSVTLTIPETSAAGDHSLFLCWNQSCPLQETLTITPAPPSPTATPSPSPSATPTPQASTSTSPTTSASP